MQRNCIYKRNNSYQVRIRVNGAPHISRTFRSRPLAESFLRAWRQGDPKAIARVEAQGQRKSKVKTIQQLFDRVDRKRWSGNSSCKAPIEGSYGNARRFITWVGPKTLVREALSEDTVWAFLDEREQLHGNAGSTVNRYAAAICTLATEAIKLYLITEKPETVRRREGQPRKRIFDECEEKALLQTIVAWGYEDHAALFTFLIDTACRPGEVQQLVWADFVDDKIHLESEITKNSTRRTLTGTPRVMAAVRRMREKYLGIYPGPFSWATRGLYSTRKLWGRLRNHFDWMGKDCVMYTFRHTCASKLVQRDADLYKVQIWLGHKGPTMTQRYAKFRPDQLAELAAVLSKPNAKYT